LRAWRFERSNLVALCVYDRETNCRRAAAAAFQENVGRQGQFPHGIEIVTAADFFSVGNRARAFLQIAPQIAAFEEYRSVLVADLLDNKCRHWDRAVRELAAEALGKLVPCMPAFMVDTALPLVVRVHRGRLAQRLTRKPGRVAHRWAAAWPTTLASDTATSWLPPRFCKRWASTTVRTTARSFPKACATRFAAWRRDSSTRRCSVGVAVSSCALRVRL
jgi:hypothetical protein